MILKTYSFRGTPILYDESKRFVELEKLVCTYSKHKSKGHSRATNKMTIPAHSQTDYAFEHQSHADCALENQTRDDACEVTTEDSEPSKQSMDCRSMAPPPPKIFIRRKREGAVNGKPTAGAHQPKPDLNWICQARRNAFEEICAFDLLSDRDANNCDDDSRWAQIWNAFTAENNIRNIHTK